MPFRFLLCGFLILESTWRHRIVNLHIRSNVASNCLQVPHPAAAGAKESPSDELCLLCAASSPPQHRFSTQRPLLMDKQYFTHDFSMKTTHLMDKQHMIHYFSTKTALLMDKQHFTRNFSIKTVLPMDKPDKYPAFSMK